MNPPLKITWRLKGVRAALASAVFLGFAPIFGKQAILIGFSPLAVVAFRTCIAALLVIFVIAVFQRSLFYIYPVGFAGCLLAGFINGLGSILYYTGLSRIDASIGQLIYSFYPLFFALWLLLDRQSLHRITLVRLILAVPGIYLLVNNDQNPVDLLGAAMMAGAAILYAFHLLINQRILYEVPAPTVTVYTLASMALTVLVAFLLYKDHSLSRSMDYSPILALAAITFFSRITLFLGVKHLGGLQTSLIGLMELLITVILAHFWLGENLSNIQWIGAGLLSSSLLLVSFDRVTHEKRRVTGWLSWLNPPQIRQTDIPWQN